MQMKKTKVVDLKPDKENARRHDESNLNAVKSSLENFGQQKPVVIDADKNIIAGNCTVKAAIELGWETINTITTELNKKDAVAYAIADNRSSELGEWEGDVLKFLVDSNEIDLKSIGFDVASFDIATGEADWGGSKDPDLDADSNEPTTSIVIETEMGLKNEVENAIEELIYKNKWELVKIKK